jgi:hypothetical protein
MSTRLTHNNNSEGQRIRFLANKLSNKTITPNEAQELRVLLEAQEREAVHDGNFLVVMAIGFLLGLVIGYLANE